jgi:hypothetical protein
MDLLQIWFGVAVAAYVLAGLLVALERLRGWRQDRSIRARLQTLHRDPPPEEPWLTEPQEPGRHALRRTRFGRRPPHVLAPGIGGRPILEGYAEHVHA